MLKESKYTKLVAEQVRHANIGITLDIYSHVLPGLQEEAAEKFDIIFETYYDIKSKCDVSKMLANEGEVTSEPCEIRTHDTMISGQGFGAAIN